MGIRLALIIGLAAASAAVFAAIYKTVDADGNVVFTDIAPVDRSGQTSEQAVSVRPMNTYEPAAQATPTEAEASESTAPGYYAALDVVSPAEDETIRDNAGDLQIEVTLTPARRADHRLLLVLDGAPTEIEALDGVFALTNVDRGTHTAGAEVVDRQGHVLIESNPVTFHLLRVAQNDAPPVPTPRKQ